MLTVMFVDLVGSTALGARLDPEDLREVIAAFHGCVTGRVARYDGFVARYMGDGVLIYFGYPQAHEDDAERAVRAGLGIVESVTQLSTVAGPPGTLSTRVGIASGLVVVGDLIGFGSSLESAAVGDTPNLAARLQTVAEPNKIVISDTTRRLTGNLFEYQELASPNLKGRSAAENAWIVLGESVIDSRFEALHRGTLPLVGRAEEIELLLRRWDRARAGEGRVVLLSGEPGIGKSRLVAALEQEARKTPHVRIRFFCSLHHQDTPLYPVIRQVERTADFERGDTAEAKREKLSRLLSAEASAVDLALFSDLLSIPRPSSVLPEALTPQRQKEMTFDAIVRQFETVSRKRPILAILEDMHWADPTTLDLLDLLIEAAERLPMLLVITSRPGARPVWASRPHVTVQMLSGLDRRTAVALIKQMAGGRDLPHDVIDRIISHADGVPLFLEELTRTVLQRGLSRKNGEGTSRLEPLSADVVPTSLHASLMARLDRFPGSKEVAQIGAVIGRDFSFETLQALSPLPLRQLEQAVGELADAEIISTRGQPPFAVYTFKHALVQDAAYASLLRDRRRAIHLRLAERMEKDTLGAAREPELIARHFAEAGVPDRSIQFYLKAAEQATGRFALAEMVSHLRNGLNQLEQLSNSADKPARELSLLVALGRALIDHEGSASDEVRTTFERARELCLALDERQLLPRVYDGLALNYHFTHSQPQKILHYAREMLELGQRTSDRQAVLMARRGEGQANLLLGRFERACEAMRAVIDIYDPQHDGPHAGMSSRDPKVSICTLLGICLTAMGYPERGSAMSLDGVRHAESQNHVISLILGLRRACLQGMMERNTRAVGELSDRLIAVRAAYETFKGSREGTIFHDWAQLRTRSDPTLLDRMHVSIEQLDAAQNWALLPFFMASAAELRGEHGDVGAAAALLDRAAELVKLTGEQWCQAEIMRLQARFSTSDPGEAATLLLASIAKAKEQGAKLWELRAAITLAELWRDQGQHAAAADILAPIYGWFTEGLRTPDLMAARALLDDLARRNIRPSEAPPIAPMGSEPRVPLD